MKRLVFIGAGPATFYALMDFKKWNEYEVVVIDKGKALEYRSYKKDVLFGFGGAGTFSDYKMVFDPSVSNPSLYEKLKEYTGNKGMWIPKKKYNIDIESYGFIDAGNDVLHIGTELAPKVLNDIYNILISKGVKFIFESEVVDIQDTKVILKDGTSIFGDKIFIAVGRTGKKFIDKILPSKIDKGNIDVGIRVEIPYNDIVKDISYTNYDMKLKKGNIRTFCVNHYSAEIVTENTGDRLQVNGHSYGLNCDKDKVTNKSNFAVLYTLKDININSYLKDLDSYTLKKTFSYSLKDAENLIYPFNECITFTKELCSLLKVKDEECNIYLPEIKMRNDNPINTDTITLIGDCGGTRGIVPAACSGIEAINKL